MSGFFDPRIHVRLYQAPWEDGIQVLLAVPGGMRQEPTVAEPLTMRPYKQGEAAEPTFRLDRQMAQDLMDQLWMCGLRPTEGKGSAGALAATQKHLEDMRALAFGQAQMPKP